MKSSLPLLAGLLASMAPLWGSPFEAPEFQSFIGVCDASAVVALDQDHFALGDDEDNALRIYSWRQGGKPMASLETSAFLKVASKQPEVDIEGAARLGDLIYWISSHGRNADGQRRTSRHRLFATRYAEKDGKPYLEFAGQPYDRLLPDLLKHPGLLPFRLKSASKLAPKEAGGLNIEGLCPTPGGGLLIGFRNPIPRGQTLLVPLLNPEAVIGGQRAVFGNPLLLDLAGRGVRSITYWRDRYYIVAGFYADGGQSALYEWSGANDRPVEIALPLFKACNPEAISWFESSDPPRLLVTSDDGTVKINGRDCKRQQDPNLKTFRAFVIPLED